MVHRQPAAAPAIQVCLETVETAEAQAPAGRETSVTVGRARASPVTAAHRVTEASITEMALAWGRAAITIRRDRSGVSQNWVRGSIRGRDGNDGKITQANSASNVEERDAKEAKRIKIQIVA